MSYFGDVDGNGKINYEDLLLCSMAINYGEQVLTLEEFERADAIEDGKINTQDFLAIRNHISGVEILNEIQTS